MPRFREKGDPVICLYQQRKGKTGQSVDQVFPHMIWGVCLYRDDASKISFILEAPDDARQAPGRQRRAGAVNLGVPGTDKGTAVKRMLAAISGMLSTVPLTSRSAYSMPSAGTSWLLWALITRWIVFA